MSEKKILTKEIAEGYLEDEFSIPLDEFTEIDAAAAEILIDCDGLELNGLDEINASVATNLSQISGELYLNGLKQLSDSVADAISQFSGTGLYLNGLKELSDSAAESLSKLDIDTEAFNWETGESYHGGTLMLSGLTDISAEAAESLSNFKGAELGLRPNFTVRCSRRKPFEIRGLP